MQKLISAISAVALSMCSSVSADALEEHWTSARVKWNAVGDRAAAGERSALDLLDAAVSACVLDEVCAQGSPPLVPPSQKQIDAASAAINIGWLYNEGKLGEPKPVRAMDFYTFAGNMDHPLGAYNMAVLLKTGKFDLQQYPPIETLYQFAADNGHVDSAIALAKLSEKAGDKTKAAGFYQRALQNQPSQSQHDIAEKGLAAMRASSEQSAPAPKPQPAPQPVAAAAKPQIDQARLSTARDCIARVHEIDEGGNARAMWIERCAGNELTQPEYDMVCKNNTSNQFCRNSRHPGPSIPASQPAPQPAAAPAKPQLNQAHLSTARDCIARANETSRMKSNLRRDERKLKEWKKDLQLSKRKLDNTYNYIPSGPEGDLIQRAANNNYARLNDEIDDYNAMDADVDQYRREHNRKADEWNDRCVGAKLTKPEYDVACTNNRSNLFCAGFDYKN